MSWTRTLDTDPVTRTVTKVHYDAATDIMTTFDEQEVGDIYDVAKEVRKAQPKWGKWKGDWHMVGILPNVVYWDLWKKGMLPSQDPAAFRKWWNEHQGSWNTKTGRL